MVGGKIIRDQAEWDNNWTQDESKGLFVKKEDSCNSLKPEW